MFIDTEGSFTANRMKQIAMATVRQCKNIHAPMPQGKEKLMFYSDTEVNAGYCCDFKQIFFFKKIGQN